MANTSQVTTREITVQDDESPFPRFVRRFFILDTRVLHHLAILWRNRFLAYALTVRGVRARYKQSFIGVGWALLTPLAMTIVTVQMYAALNLAQRKEGVFPCPPGIYLLFTLAFWNFFSRAVTNGSTALVANMDLVTKVYFPREVLPISSVLTNLIDLGLSFLLWALYAAGYSAACHWSLFGLSPEALSQWGHGFYPHTGWLWLPVLLLLNLLLILGLVFIASTMQVYFRDVAHLINLGLLLWLMITPVLYPIHALPGGRMTTLINLNPMTGIIDGYRLALISHANPWYSGGRWEHHVVGAALFSLMAFLLGYSFFKHEERYFADVV